jgi:hypothetical protein
VEATARVRRGRLRCRCTESATEPLAEQFEEHATWRVVAERIEQERLPDLAILAAEERSVGGMSSACVTSMMEGTSSFGQRSGK